MTAMDTVGPYVVGVAIGCSVVTVPSEKGALGLNFSRKGEV